MKREDLLEAIGHVDNSLLAESEQTHVCRRSSVFWKAGLAAAIVVVMAVSALAATKLLSRPVERGGIVTEGTISPVTFIGGDIYPEPQVGLKVVMEVEVDEDAPRTLEEIYHLKLSEDWTESFRSGVGNGFEYHDYTAVWKKDGVDGEVRLRQTTVEGYISGSNGEHVVDCLHELPLDTEVTAQVVTLGGRQLLQVTIPPVELEGYADQNVACYREGEYRLYWTDGRYMFRLDCPSWVSGAEAEQMLLSLYAEAFTPEYPEGWGQIDTGRLKKIRFRDGNGTTSFNISNAATGALYGDGVFFFGDPGAIRMYDMESGELTVIQTWENSLPQNMLLTEDGVCFADSKFPRWGKYHMALDGRTVEALFEGVYLGDMWACGNGLYGIDAVEGTLLRIDLETGEKQTLAGNVNKYYMDEAWLYVLPREGNFFLRAPRDTMEFERIELTFQPISMAVDGEDHYFTVGGQVEGRRYQVVRYRDGVEERLSVYGTRLQIIGGKLLYDADPDSQLIELYDPESGQTELLQKNVFDYFVFEDRYVVFNYYNDGWGILDWEIGELTKIEEFSS